MFVEVSDRTGAPEESETLDAERRLDWSGLCLESSRDRVRAARGIRDCTVATDGAEALEAVLARNAISPIAIDWLNLAVRSPHELLREGGRLDPERVRANLISMPLADADEAARCLERLAPCGYEASAGSDGAGGVLVRTGRDDVFGFYHLFAANNWREVLAEQVRRLQASGLAEATRRIFATVVGPDFGEARRALEEAFGPRLQVVAEGDDASGAERPVLQFARWFSEHGEPLARGVWYLHSKGVSSRNAANPNVGDWRRLMEAFVIDGWRDCVDALRDHDVCGVNWHEHPEPHFSGNFWWATPRYLARLRESIGVRPFDPEGWIGSAQPRVRCLHESGVDHYVTPYPETAYG